MNDEFDNWERRCTADGAPLEVAGARQAKLEAVWRPGRAVARVNPRPGLLNQWAFDSDIVAVHGSARSDGSPYALLLCDLDRFSSYSKRYGWDGGDQVLSRPPACVPRRPRGVGEASPSRILAHQQRKAGVGRVGGITNFRCANDRCIASSSPSSRGAEAPEVEPRGRMPGSLCLLIRAPGPGTIAAIFCDDPEVDGTLATAFGGALKNETASSDLRGSMRASQAPLSLASIRVA